MRYLVGKIRYFFGVLVSLFASRITAVKCGHRTRSFGPVSAFGHFTITHMKLNEAGTVDYCLDCLGKMAIRCGCGHVIFIGDPIVLYHSPGPVRAVILGDYSGHPVYVGCIYCSDSAANISGYWVPGEDGKGMIHRILNGYEIALLLPR